MSKSDDRRKALVKAELLRDVPLSWEESNSSLVTGASYDADQERMTVLLKSGEVVKTYAYDNVAPSIWIDFSQAESKGQYFSRFIRPVYTPR